ncbi:60S acidic ribosomal protein P1-like [Phyllostomus discolor]|uniref:Large ribosomal subunit protein P1 n=1 Tax=Phyllostomus discolor TaxID=89673 RepID=A0A6J2LDJ9_9CHIR|nr:60S acidic ribosomal protein P1-like [Phyllostomus discolor]
MATISELTFICLALILHDNEVTVTVMKDKMNALIKADGVNLEPFWPCLFAKALVQVDIRSLIGPCLIGNIGAGGPATAADSAPAGGLAPTTAVPAKKEESEEFDDDTGFGLFD